MALIMIRLFLTRLHVLIHLLVFSSVYGYSQHAYQHTSDRGIYNFLDELSSLHIINAASVIKPYARKHILSFLLEANEHRHSLTKAQQSRLDNFLYEYQLELGKLKSGRLGLVGGDTLSLHLLPPEATYNDGFFRILMRPVFGYRNFSGGNTNFWVTYGGVEVVSYVGDKFSVYASLRDNYQNGQRLAQPSYFTQEPGGTYKRLTGGGVGGEFSEMRGGGDL
jgi:hypothetical protein